MIELIVYRPHSAVHVHVQIEWQPQTLTAEVDDHVYAVPRMRDDRGQRDDEATIIALYGQLEHDGWQPRSCADCIFFRSSGLAQQFSGRRAGYCAKVGFRRPWAIVSLDHDCGEHEPVSAWPDDLDAVARERLQRSDEAPYPSRLPAILAALTGFCLFESLAPQAWPLTTESLTRWQPSPYSIEPADSSLLSVVDHVVAQPDATRDFWLNWLATRLAATKRSQQDKLWSDHLATPVTLGLALGLQHWSRSGAAAASNAADPAQHHSVPATSARDAQQASDLRCCVHIMQWTALAMQKRSCDQMRRTLWIDAERPASAGENGLRMALQAFCDAAYNPIRAMGKLVDDGVAADRTGNDKKRFRSQQRLAIALVAAIGGAYHGPSGLPSAWRDAVLNPQAIESRAAQIVSHS